MFTVRKLERHRAYNHSEGNSERTKCMHERTPSPCVNVNEVLIPAPPRIYRPNPSRFANQGYASHLIPSGACMLTRRSASYGHYCVWVIRFSEFQNLAPPGRLDYCGLLMRIRCHPSRDSVPGSRDGRILRRWCSCVAECDEASKAGGYRLPLTAHPFTALTNRTNRDE